MASSGFVAAAPEAGGLILRDFQGAMLQQLPAGRLTDIDVTSLPLQNGVGVVMGGTERSSGRTRIILYRVDYGEAQPARRWGEIATDLSEPFGFCMRQVNTVVAAVAFDRRGEARQFVIATSPNGDLVARETRRFRVRNPGPGCAIVTRGDHLFVSHSQRGFWRYPLDPTSDALARRTSQAGPAALPRSVGVEVLSTRRHTFLASLDHDRAAFSLWRIEGDDLVWQGRIQVRDSDGRILRSINGFDAYGSSLEGFPDGMGVLHGQAGATAPVLRFFDWSAVERALGL